MDKDYLQDLGDRVAKIEDKLGLRTEPTRSETSWERLANYRQKLIDEFLIGDRIQKTEIVKLKESIKDKENIITHLEGELTRALVEIKEYKLTNIKLSPSGKDWLTLVIRELYEQLYPRQDNEDKQPGATIGSRNVLARD